MMDTPLIIDLVELFKGQFGIKPYTISAEQPVANPAIKYTGLPVFTPLTKEFTEKGSLLREQYLGIEIFLPVRLFDESGGNELMYLPYCVLKISGKNSYVNTPLIDRAGTVKELYSNDDYKITLKGFLIGTDRKFPEADLIKLKRLFTTNTALVLDNAISNVFLTDNRIAKDEQKRVVITSFELPEVQGGREHVRPFSIEMESDTIFDLELA